MKKIVYVFAVEAGWGEDYRHPAWDFFEITTDVGHDGRPRQRITRSLFRIEGQMDRRNGYSLFKTYALRAQDVDISDPTAVGILSFFTSIPYFRRQSRAVQKAIKRLNIERVVLDPKYGMFIPYKHRRTPEAWIETIKTQDEERHDGLLDVINTDHRTLAIPTRGIS